jgi:hypothetical protein
MRSTFLFSSLLIFAVAFGQPEEYTVKSPDGVIEIAVSVSSNGMPEFDLFYKDTPVMKKNRLGVVRDDADFSKGLTLVSVSGVKSVDDRYTLLSGKKSICTYRANQRVFRFSVSDGRELDIIFQLSADGVAFRYFFPAEQAGGLKKILDETTQFDFGEGTRAWIQPIAEAKSGWNHVNPSYEEHYQESAVEDLPPSTPGWAFPALFKSGKYWIALTETAPDRNYCGCRLVHESGSATFSIGFPQSPEVLPGGSLNPESLLPWYTPWRIIALSDNLGTLVESTLGTDLAKPNALPDFSFVKPGRSSWSWVLYKDDSTTFPVQKRFVDYASDMGWEYCLVDADWDRRIGYEKLGELCTYAASRHVGINAWYNSAGSWNTTPYTPRDRMLTKESREAEFKKLASLGVKGVKVDFFGGDGQSVMTYYQDIFEDAARHGLMVNCHGATVPRGWQRTYPNLVTMEAIRGFEFVTFDQQDADQEARHCTVIPFTRNLFDPMDFTPVCFSEVPNIRRRTTNTFELALSVLFLSGIQHFAEVPEGMAKVPNEVRQVLREVPVTWDESRFVDGYPAKYVVIARKKRAVWYVAGINGEQTEKTLSLDLGFVGASRSSVLMASGADNRSFEIDSNTLSVRKPLAIVLKAYDGFLLKILTE